MKNPYWGVCERKEKRTPRKKFEDMYFDSSVAAEYSRALADSTEYVLNGLPSLADRVSKAFYYATIKVQGKPRYLGKSFIPQKAARLYDAALFHLWGFLKNPRPRFNFYKPGIDPTPPIDETLANVIAKVKRELREMGIDPESFSGPFNPNP